MPRPCRSRLSSTVPFCGANRIDFQFTAAEAGFLRFRVVVEAARDTFNENDRADANTIVKGGIAATTGSADFRRPLLISTAAIVAAGGVAILGEFAMAQV